MEVMTMLNDAAAVVNGFEHVFTRQARIRWIYALKEIYTVYLHEKTWTHIW